MSNDPIFINLINCIISRPKKFENIPTHCKHKVENGGSCCSNQRGESYNGGRGWGGAPSLRPAQLRCVKPSWAAESQNRDKGREGGRLYRSIPQWNYSKSKSRKNEKQEKINKGKEDGNSLLKVNTSQKRGFFNILVHANPEFYTK